MADMPPHLIGLPGADALGPDPEPPGTRFELLLERTREHTPHKPEVRTRVEWGPGPQRPSKAQVRHQPRRRAHVVPR